MTIEEKQIKNAVIDLLHNNEEASLDAIARITGMSLISLQEHSASIQSMLAKLKKAHTTPKFKS